MNKTYKVLTRFSDKAPYRTFREFPTMAEAMAAAARLERNTELQTLVELPDNELKYVPLHLLELTA
jgi:hypothetical protein